MDRSWRDAASSAPTGHAALKWDDNSHLSELASAPLRRHVDHVRMSSHSQFAWSPSYRREFASVMPHLRRLDCSIRLLEARSHSEVQDDSMHDEPDIIPWPLSLPTRLHTLRLTLPSAFRHTDWDSQLFEIMQSLAPLRCTLATLHLAVPNLPFCHGAHRSIYIMPGWFAWVLPLARLTHLQSFTFEYLAPWRSDPPIPVEWPDDAIEAMRGMTSLTYIDCLGLS